MQEFIGELIPALIGTGILMAFAVRRWKPLPAGVIVAVVTTALWYWNTRKATPAYAVASLLWAGFWVLRQRRKGGSPRPAA